VKVVDVRINLVRGGVDRRGTLDVQRPRPCGRIEQHGDDHDADGERDLLDHGVNSLTGRTSTLPSRAGGIFAATWMASFRSRASIR
jgi:hypothetical protein